jgi:SsrA-binding protein
MNDTHVKIIATNRKAWHDYSVDYTLEAGMSLLGTEVKSLRARQVSYQDAYATIDRGQVILKNLHIKPYSHGSTNPHEPLRPRRLLLRRIEINKLAVRVDERGYTLIPLKLYFKNGKVKVELGVCKGKRKYDKREALKKRDQEREIASSMRQTRKEF